MSDDEVPTLVPAGGQEKTTKPLGMRKNGIACNIPMAQKHLAI